MPILTTDAALTAVLRASKTIAIVGMSDRQHRDSFRIGEYLLDQGYTIIPVNPGIRSALGIPAVAQLEDIPTPIDMVNIFRRPEFVPDIVASAIALHIRSVWMQLGVGHQEAAARAASAGMSVVIERCIMIEHRRLHP